MLSKSIHDLVFEDFDNYTLWITIQHDVPDGVDTLVSPIDEYSHYDLIP